MYFYKLVLRILIGFLPKAVGLDLLFYEMGWHNRTLQCHLTVPQTEVRGMW